MAIKLRALTEIEKAAIEKLARSRTAAAREVEVTRDRGDQTIRGGEIAAISLFARIFPRRQSRTSDTVGGKPDIQKRFDEVTKTPRGISPK